MNKHKQKELRKLKAVTQKIIKEYAPEKIILFGSYAWGIPTEDSDFDLLVLKKHKNRLNEEKKIRHIVNGEIAADILVYTPKQVEKRLRLGDFFFEDILQKGHILYAN